MRPSASSPDAHTKRAHELRHLLAGFAPHSPLHVTRSSIASLGASGGGMGASGMLGSSAFGLGSLRATGRSLSPSAISAPQWQGSVSFVDTISAMRSRPHVRLHSGAMTGADMRTLLHRLKCLQPAKTVAVLAAYEVAERLVAMAATPDPAVSGLDPACLRSAPVAAAALFSAVVCERLGRV